MSPLFLVTCLAGMLLVVAGMVLAYLGPGQRPKPLPPDDPLRRAQLDVAARLQRRP